MRAIEKFQELFYSHGEDLPSYLRKIRQCRNSFDINYRYERNYFSNKLEKAMENVAYFKIVSEKSGVKSRAYFDAFTKIYEIEKAFSYSYSPEVAIEIIEKLESNCPSNAKDIIECLIDIIEDPEVFGIFIEFDEMERSNEKINNFIDMIDKLSFNDKGELDEEVVDLLKDKINDIYGCVQKFDKT